MTSLLQDLAPFQLIAMVWLQSIAVFLYGRLSRRTISAWTCFFIMLATTVVAWLIDMYAFIRFKDWITAGVLLAFGFITSLHGMMEVKWANRYNASFEEKTLAVVQFYTDPVLVPLGALKHWCKSEKNMEEQNLQSESI